MAEDFDVNLDTPKYYTPSAKCTENAWAGDYSQRYQEFLADPTGFWEDIARELEWYQDWDEALEWNYPYAKWFLNGKLNVTTNCLDRHVFNQRRNKVALMWRGETDDEERIYTYKQLYHAVCRFANGLKSLGVQKGDRVCIYMPVVPEQLIAMLACARIGAVHTVVFGGFGVSALNQRIRAVGAKIVVAADVTVRRGKAIPLKTIVEDAVVNAPSVERIVVLRREETKPVELHPEMEIDFEDLMENQPRECPAEPMDAEDPLFILFTSGTTGEPKGIVHACGGYMVGTYYTTKHVFDVKDNDVYWCTADPGWITGHSYGVYGPLLTGATCLITETTPDYPDAGIWWNLIEEYGVTIFYTAPTAIRMFMRVGEEWPKKYNLSSLRVLGSVGEPLNPEAFEWFYHVIGGAKCPIADTWWQTETGMHMITTMIGEPMRPGFAGKPVPGIVADVVDSDGNSVPPGTGGLLVVKGPWPSMMRTIWENDERYRKYWETIPGCYTAADLAVKDENGYIMVIGRSDDLIVVAGHNIGTAEVESALVSHKAVAEAAVIGKPDPLKGNTIKAFVILIQGHQPTEKLRNELVYHVRMTLGPIAIPSELEFVESLPKTRSGKIMRRVLKAKEMGMDPGDISTLED
ncbi:acetate--CoA ligase [Methanoculleus sp. FWC-SCC1]|uniref:Acetate--CoA ligase n=1 Tax=Methanoculleus frigidifontis TaxID=2584085 RepID=A0ABT8M7L1_9EURY|nr:acetate--CoA ligase [Methanoculleus sp. FWC-SCC1]MDN7023916.1 acetate--CoA ligase [Methanoculleus sp. FWC-SCC1]